jgi:dTDP-D-glucose 4,6-dehydratase
MDYAIRAKLLKLERRLPLSIEKVKRELVPYVVVRNGICTAIDWYKTKIDWAQCLKEKNDKELV